MDFSAKIGVKLFNTSPNNYIYRIIFCSTISLVFFLFSFSQLNASEKQISITNISRGNDGAFPFGHAGVITTKDLWDQFWAALHANKTPVPQLSKIWFGDEVVAYCVGGQRPTGGYQMVIKDAIATPGGIVVRCYEHIPNPTQFVIQAVTQPYHIVRLRLTPSIKRILPQDLPWKIEYYQEIHRLGQIGQRKHQGRPPEMVGLWKGQWVKVGEFDSKTPIIIDDGDDPRY